MTATAGPAPRRGRRTGPPPTPRWWALACWALVAASLVVVTGLWLDGGGAGNWRTAAGRRSPRSAG
ncbi:hypothetical protein ACWKSP_14705 [Micromonosporaceae bacterium Da 78-11]